MLAYIKELLIEYLRTEVNGGTLSGINSIVSGRVTPQSIATTKYPAISVYVNEASFSLPCGGNSPVSMEGTLMLELITAQSKSNGDCENDCLKLVWSDDGTKGIVMALQKKQGFVVGTRGFLVTANEQTIKFVTGKPTEDGFSAGAIIPLVVQTMK